MRHFEHGERIAASAGGRAGAPAKPGHYDAALRLEQLAGAVRRGLIVIAYRAQLDRERVEQLVALQMLVPAGTVVSPDPVRRSYDVVASGYRRQLRCPRFSDRTIDALRLFRGRYVGIGPESR